MKSEKHGRSSRFGISEKRWLEIGWRHLLVRASDIECKKEGLVLEQHIGVCGNWKRVKCSGNSVEVQGDVIVVGDERWLYLICCSVTKSCLTLCDPMYISLFEKLGVIRMEVTVTTTIYVTVFRL